MTNVLLASLLLAAILSSPAVAERAPLPVAADSRLRTVPFERDNVVTIWGTRGVSTIIVLHDDEKIATVALGDTIGWQAVPDQSKQFLFIKPLEPDAVTNMTVVTTRKRIYSFILRTSSGHDRRVVFKVRFTYPDEEADARLLEKARQLAAFPNKRNAENSSIRNFDYSYKGAPYVKPEHVFDDGTKTYFRFSGDVPGIFLVNPDRSETLVNYRREGGMIVVDRTAGQWTMRNGAATACVFNMRAEADPPPTAQETDVQPEIQAVHAPEGGFLTNFLSNGLAPSASLQQ
ncbi:TrbG/VirB9 family P-type conjugative transfer protein [Methylocystis sp. ATCC 49242]|jgi:type IV secretion system protein VirB9|uniref:TrbG/VirB9 family P-type conjugative transfer protein n=1 Tax=Methylocystis sp. ATCC 49242 TaxID=622637 RepID=UPI0001F88096|nr:TrbG/VirB9 family P-type conjugative transfer protein [Methylocystis sp. ATCC 49242]